MEVSTGSRFQSEQVHDECEGCMNQRREGEKNRADRSGRIPSWKEKNASPHRAIEMVDDQNHFVSL
ncbi:MAG: hypothetical protein ABI273_09155 [Lacunisphaera sp.]